MFDLKAKLLKHGLVTEEQVAKATAQQEKTYAQGRAQDFSTKERFKALESLKAQNKPEQYATIRKWVEHNRLDKEHLISLDCEKFFLQSKDEQVTWLSLPKDLIEGIKTGAFGVISFMSHHGLSHAVVPRDIAEDVGAVFPDWLKVLNDKNG